MNPPIPFIHDSSSSPLQFALGRAILFSGELSDHEIETRVKEENASQNAAERP